MANEFNIRFSFKRGKIDKNIFKVYIPRNPFPIGRIVTFGPPIMPSCCDILVKAKYYKYIDLIADQFKSECP